MTNTTTKAKRTYRDCRRCAGTGDWAPGRVCFRCAGKGRELIMTKALEIEAKQAHIAESQAEIAKLEARKAGRPATGFGRWRDTDEARLENYRANLARLEVELAALLGGAS